MTQEITIPKGFDAHFHPRDGEMMKIVLPYTTRQFAGGICMGNLSGDDVIDTIEKRLIWIGKMKVFTPDFHPVVPLMVTRDLLQRKNAVLTAIARGARVFKFIPGGLTTNGADGLSLYDFYAQPFTDFFRHLEACGGIFSCHFEVGVEKIHKMIIDPRSQEKEAVQFLKYLLEAFPRLKIVVEHASTHEMISFIEGLSKAPEYKVAATLTPHHALISWDMVCHPDGKIKNPGLYCKPICKSQQDVNSVVLAMCNGNPRFFAGTDSAPHPLEAKLRLPTPAAGIFNAPVALQSYAKIFASVGRINHLGNFTSVFGPRFYGLEPSSETITLIEKPEPIPEIISGIPVFLGGQETSWSIAN